MATRYSPKIVTDGLVLCLDAANSRSYPGTGTAWYDIAGKGSVPGGAGTKVGPTFSAEGGAGGTKSFDFDGTNDYFAIPQFDYTGTHTLEWWFKADLSEKYSGGYAGHMLCWGYTPTVRIFLMTDGSIKAYLHNTNGSITAHASNASVAAEEWTHIAYTADYSASEANVYINSSLTDSAIDISALGSWVYDGASNAYDFIDFGRNVNNNNIFFNGRLTNLKIYNRVLSLAEIQQNYNAQKGRFGK